MRLRKAELLENRKKWIKRCIWIAVLLLLCVLLAVRFWPRSTETMIETAASAMEQENYEKAAKLYLTVLKREPEITVSLVGLMEAAEHMQNTELTELAVRKLISIFPNEKGYYDRLAEIYMDTGRPEQADAVLESWQARQRNHS